MCFEVNRIKVGEANSKPVEYIEKYRDYVELVWKITCKNLVKHKKKIINYHLRGRKHGYDLDHKYSISEAFINNIDPNIVAHWKNLEIIKDSDNRTKQEKSSITIEELIHLIESE